jgi:hypothetical protein
MSADLVKKQPSLFLLIDQSIKIPGTTRTVPDAPWALAFRCSAGGSDE